MYQGVIKKIVGDKGFGFITVEGRAKDLFFHASGLAQGKSSFDSLREGDNVQFRDIENNGKGESAIGVEVI